MNTNQLKRFAQEARRKLIQQITAKLDWVLQSDSPELREKTKQVEALNKALRQSSKEQVVEQVAYTWFNRFVALRFMDVNDYQPLMVQVVSSNTGEGDAEILERAKQGSFSEELKLNKQRLLDLLDGRIPSNNAQNVVYRELLIASCNYLHTIFPFLFERIEDYSELLLPDDLISEFSILHDIVENMSAEDCQEVEILGWLYQFYISEKKDEVFAKKGKVDKEEIPAATQLFTPRWIVEYMVQNTVGKLWMQNYPNSSLKEKMPYYIETEASKSEQYLKIDSPEDITLLDQACGSGHILVYGFELLYQLYEEAGYTASQIPELIIEKNLLGYEIDERAAQLASFSVLMKARTYYRRLFRKNIKPNILCYRDLTLSSDEIEQTLQSIGIDASKDLLHDLKSMQEATNLGSLIQPQATNNELQKALKAVNTQLLKANLFDKQSLESIKRALEQLIQLGTKVSCVVDNPPYMGGGNMNKELSDFVKKNYPDSKADLMACFMESGLASLKDNGLLGMINQHSWMFLSSYEKLREKLIDNALFDTLLHLGPRAFPEIGGEVVQNAAFTFINKEPKLQGTYIRLVDYNTSDEKRTKTVEAIQNPNCGWFYTKNQKEFKKIPGSNIGYWIFDSYFGIFEKSRISEFSEVRQGLITGNNDKFTRFWVEIENYKIRDKWIYFNKGGSFRRWYGNNYLVVNWYNDGEEIKNYRDNRGKQLSRPQSIEFYFKEGITWSRISGNASFRYLDEGVIFADAGPLIILKDKTLIFYLLGLLNSLITDKVLSLINPTLTFQVGDIKNIPLAYLANCIKTNSIRSCISISREEWNSRETSWDFLQNELIRLKGQDASTSLSTGIEEAIDLYKVYWSKKFFELHRNEEELNAQFIEIYGLQEELTPDVPLDEITILKDELNQKELKALAETFKSGWSLVDGRWLLVDGNQQLTTNHQPPTTNHQPPLPFDEKELVQQFISYAVGCMFGRYSLDKEGLILANQGETIADYINIVSPNHSRLWRDRHQPTTNHQRPTTNNQQPITFMPDKDNIIPVLDNEWFTDDIAARFKEFVRVVWGTDSYQRNIKYIEDVLQKDIRRYFSRDFYADHIKRYKKRPIYWMFSSPKGAFNVLIYMHRYTPDTISNILNNYLREFIGKLELQIEQLERVKNEGSTQEQAKVEREINEYQKDLLDCQQYEREILFDLATERIAIDLDNGVLVNYNKLGDAVALVSGLNDAKARKKVEGFDWV